MKLIFNKALPFLCIIFFSVVMLGANPLNDETVAPTDILANYPGWQNLNINVPVRHPNRSDILDARLARWFHAKNALRNGEIPIWNPYPINGTPGIQWLPAAIITPAFLIFSSFDDNALGYYFALLTNLIIAALGSYLLLYQLTKSRLASVFGALVFAYSGYHAAWLYWAHVSSSIWIPWLLLLTHNYLASLKLVYLPWLSIVTAFMIFGGFPTITVYAFITMVLMFIVYTPWSNGLKHAAKSALFLSLFITLAFVITLFAIHSLYEMLQFTHAMETRNGRGGTPLTLEDFYRFYQPLIGKFPSVEETFYVGIIPLFLLTISAILLLLGRFTLNLIFALALLAITVAISFGLLPHDFIRSIPTFNSNSWSRMTILAAVAFSILSADIIALFLRSDFINRRAAFFPIILVTALITLQFVDLRSLFRHFNGPVPSTTFFPTTATIDYVKQNIKPLQSVLADRVYLTSGTLTNFAVSDWFAHGFKRRAEFRFLEDNIAPGAHVTKTAAMLHCEDANLHSRYMTFLGIRYLLCNKSHTDFGRFQTVLATSGESHQPSHLITPENPLIQRFNLPNAIEFDKLTIQLATYSQADSYTDVSVRLYSGDLLQGESTVKASTIHDNQWVDFNFPNRIRLPQTNNRMEIHALPSNKVGKLSAWLYPINPGAVYIEDGDKQVFMVVAAKFNKAITIPDHLVPHQIENNLELYENINVKGSGYTVSELADSNTPNFEHLELLSHSDTAYQFHYSGNQPAWLIIPTRLYPQWQAYVNDKPVENERFMDMLPAIHVEPDDIILYRYNPIILYWLTSLGFAGLAFTLFLAYRWRNK